MMWSRHVNWNAQTFPNSLLEVGYRTVTDVHQSPGLKVVEVAHDIQLAVGRYVKERLKLLNSFNTWHGMILTAMVFSLCMFALV